MKVYNSLTIGYWPIAKLVMKPLTYQAYKEPIRM